MKITWKACFMVAVSVFALYLAIHFLPAMLGFGADLVSAMSSMLVGAAVAYLVNILMSAYERHYFPRLSHKKVVMKTRRPVCIVAAFLTLIAVVALICLLIVPELIECIKTLAAVVPPFLQQAVALAEDISWIPDQVISALQSVDWKSLINKALNLVTSGVGDFFSVVTTAVSTVFSVIVTTLFAIIFSIYLLSGKDKMMRNTDRLLCAYLPRRMRDRLVHLGSVFNNCFHRYIVGQCIEAVILGALCTIGMVILRLPYATMIGALIAFTALIPIAGAYIGAGVGAFMILTVSPMKALIFLIFLIILQQFEGNVIYPRVVGTSLGLPGIWVLFAVTVGGGLYGVVGMLLGVPLVAAIYRLVKEDLARREGICPGDEEGLDEPREQVEELAAAETENAEEIEAIVAVEADEEIAEAEEVEEIAEAEEAEVIEEAKVTEAVDE